VLVDDELIYAYYDQQLPADVCSGHSFERWYREESKRRSESTLLRLTRDELMRHEAAGITTASFPKTIRLGGVDCAANYLHEPGDARDGLTVTVPLFVLNQVNDERCEWLVPGMLKDKVQALLKTLHQRPRSRLVPLPDTATKFAEVLNTPERFGSGALIDAVVKLVREATSVDVARADIKADMLTPHFFMNFRVVDEHGRQLGHGRNLGALKAELGALARGAFQALAGLKLAQVGALTGATPAPVAAGNAAAATRNGSKQNVPLALVNTQHGAIKSGVSQVSTLQAKPNPSAITEQRHTAWTFGELPELLEIRKGGQTLIGFPALIDQGDAVTIEVFDEPEVSTAKHRAGLRRLFSLQIKDALKYLEKNIPDLQKMAVAYMNVGKAENGTGGGTLEELREQIIAVALDRAFLLDPLPTDEVAFRRRVEEGRGRLTLIATEVARMAGTILLEYATAARKVKETKNAPVAVADCAQQLQRLVPKRFLQAAPWARLQHLPRYLKAITQRLDKFRADPARDATRLAELHPLEQRYWRLVAERKGTVDERMQEFRWLLEELRVSFFAQELRTPQPVSAKRLDKAWAQLNS
jgi:ATP-dependent helicase HrpA